MARRESLNTGEKVLATAAILLVLLGILFAYWQYVSNINPVVNIPATSVPNPNARDYYLAAMQSQVRDIKVGAHTITVDRAYDTLQGEGSASPPDSKELNMLAAKNTEELTKTREGFAFRYGDAPVRSEKTLFPELAKYRTLAKTMVIEAEVKRLDGNWDAAVECDLDAIRLGVDIPNGGPMVHGLVGAAIRSIGSSHAWSLLDHVSGKEASHAASRLETIAVNRITPVDMLQEEKWWGQALLLELFQNDNWRRGFQDDYIHDSFKMFFFSKRRVMRNYTDYMETAIADAKKPFPLNLGTPQSTGDPLSYTLTPASEKLIIRLLLADMQNDLLMVSFALRAYKADHGKYPADLKALVPPYLQAVPVDAFTVRGTLCYKIIGESYVLYSVGPDGKDDGGTPSTDGTLAQPKPPRRSRSNLDRGSKGDIVAGVNIR